jgi:hypothetical protein
MSQTSVEHPSREELAAVNGGKLDPARERAILSHVLLPPCEACLRALPPLVRIFLGLESPGAELTPEEDAAYDRAIDRSFMVARKHARHLRNQKAKTEQGVKILQRGGTDGPASLPRTLNDYARFRALLEQSWALRFEDPKLMLQLARHALQCAGRIDARKYGHEQVSDFQCEAQAEVGNALRLTDQLGEAEFALARARQLFNRGTHSELLEMRLLELEATLDADQRRFEDASNRLEKVYRYYRQHHENHLAGRALLKQGLYISARDPSKALELLESSLSLIEADREPVLTYAAALNQVTILLDGERYREAEKQLFFLRRLQQHSGGRINQLRFRWAEGRIDAGLDRLSRAEETLTEVRDGFVAVERSYDAALASLDLAGVLIGLRKTDTALEVLSGAYVTFAALHIAREAAASVLAVKIACEVGAATRKRVEEVTKFLRRLENDPNAEVTR